MTLRRAAALREEQAAFAVLQDLIEGDADFEAIMAAIAACSASLAKSEAIREIEEIDSHAQVLMLFDRAFW